jgi:hypothetical protein
MTADMGIVHWAENTLPRGSDGRRIGTVVTPTISHYRVIEQFRGDTMPPNH